MARTFPATPDPSRVLLIDISKWQDDPNTPSGVDFAKMKSRNVSGVIMKVGQGLYVDRSGSHIPTSNEVTEPTLHIITVSVTSSILNHIIVIPKKGVLGVLIENRVWI